MRISYLILSLLLVLGLFGCSDGSGSGDRYSWTANESALKEQAFKKMIVHDVLGGALAASVDPVKINYDDVEPTKISINVGFSTTTNEINEAFVFAGEDGVDSLTVAASGKVEEITTSETDSQVLNFKPLNLLIHFENFVFTNVCGAGIIITGDVECRVSGKFTRENESFKGNASCISGTFIDTNNISYSVNGDEHDVHFVVNAFVDGNAFSLDSYSFNGSFFIDNKITSVSSIKEEELSCDLIGE